MSAQAVDIAKTIIERILSWPIAVFLLALIYKHSLVRLINRIVTVKGAGIELSAPTETAEQQQESPAQSPTGSLTAPEPQLALPLSAELLKRQEEVRNLGSGKPIVREQIKVLEDELTGLGFTLNTPDTTNVLIRNLATTQLIARFERIYRLIFGSQIAALELLHGAPQPESVLNGYFRRARKSAPKFYGEYKFEEWLNFLKQQGLILSMGERTWGCTVAGEEFLQWMREFRLPKKQH